MNRIKKLFTSLLPWLLLFVALGTTAAEQSGSTNQSPSELIRKLEEALKQNPNDDEALEKLHLLLAEGIPILREEKLRLKQVIRQYTRHAHTVLAPPNEPGEAMVVSGTVRDREGKPIVGALVYVFHADARGYYTPDSPMDEPNSRLFGYMKTSADGRYEFRTIRPGGYPQAPIPQHIHMLVTAAGYREHKCRSTCQLLFDDDPHMTAEWHQWAKKDGNPILVVTRDKDGIQRYVYDIVLHKQ